MADPLSSPSPSPSPYTRRYSTQEIANILILNPRWEPLFNESAADIGIIEEIGVLTGTSIIDVYGCEWMTKEMR